MKERKRRQPLQVRIDRELEKLLLAAVRESRRSITQEVAHRLLLTFRPI
jgi:hypothetical protein